MPIHYFVLTFLVLIYVSFVSTARASGDTREFRPLEATKVSIHPSGDASLAADDSTGADAIVHAAWNQFDAKDWKGATDTFVSALKADPDCREAAEGLAMSIYHTGDFTSAYRLGEELKVVMPNVRRIVAETALSKVRGLIAKGEFASARAFLSHFPATGPTLVYAHNLVQTADTLTASVENGEEGSSPDESLVRN